MADNEIHNTAVIDYIEGLRTNWATARKAKEIEWQANLDAFLAESSESWKKKRKEKKGDKGEEWKSDVFVRITKIKVVMAYAFINDLLFQGGKFPFMLKPNKETYEGEDMEMAKRIAHDMKEEIDGQLVDCKADRTLMKNVFSMALYGGTYIKSPFFEEKERKGWELTYPPGYEGIPEFAMYEYYNRTEIIPSIAYRSVWSVWHDPEEEDLQKGRGALELIMSSPYSLRKMIGLPGFDEGSIEEAISENLGKSTSENTMTLPPGLRNIADPARNISYYEFWGRIPVSLLSHENDNPKFSKNLNQRFGLDVDLPSEGLESGHEIEVMIGIANDKLVRLIPNPGKRPYEYCYWERILDEFDGIGVADNLRDSQKMVNAGVRNFIDNKALSGNVILGIDDDALKPGQTNDVWPGKVFNFEGGANISQAFKGIEIPDVGSSLLELVFLFERYADEETSMPKIMQGDVAQKKKPDTLGELKLLSQNAGKYMGQVMKNIDEGALEPVIEEFYDHNMQNPDYTGAKGDFQVQALGFSSYQGKVTRAKSLQDLLIILYSDPTGMLLKESKPRAILEELVKTLDLDPDQFLLSEEEEDKVEEEQRIAQEEEEEKLRQMQEEQIEIEEEAKDGELQRDIVLEGVKAEDDKEMEAMKIEADDRKESVKFLTSLAGGKKDTEG